MARFKQKTLLYTLTMSSLLTFDKFRRNISFLILFKKMQGFIVNEDTNAFHSDFILEGTFSIFNLQQVKKDDVCENCIGTSNLSL
ncbi:hypothetical protein STEG23_019548, partial [Scotinomys teguina]